MMRILITGGFGFIGFNLFQSLMKDNKNYITLVDNLSSNQDSYKDRCDSIGIDYEKFKHCTSYDIEDNVRFYKIDITDYSKMNPLFKKRHFDVVINLAALPGVKQSEKSKTPYNKINIEGFISLSNLCVKHKIKHLVYASSSSVYGDASNKTEDFRDLKPLSHYAKTKLINEKISDITSFITPTIKITGMRFFNVYGTKQRSDMAFNLFKNAIKNEEPINLFNNGKNKRDLICVDDVVRAITLILYSKEQYKHEVFNIGTGRCITNKKYYKLIKSYVNPKSKVKPILTDRNYYESIKTKANIKKMKKYFNWSPEIKIEDKIKEFCQ